MSLLSKRHNVYRLIDNLIIKLKIAINSRRHISISMGRNMRLIGAPRFQLIKQSRLQIGDNCVLRSRPDSNPLGIDHPITFCTLASGALIQIGDRVGISGGALCARTEIVIGNGTLIGANTYIFDNDFHPLDPVERINDDYTNVRSKPVRIGTNVFIGTRCIILKGVTIGDNSIIRAGSVVTTAIPANTIAGGNPCVVVSGK